MSVIKSLKFEGLGFSFEEGQEILREVSFDFPMDKTVRISGAAGSGISSVLRLLAALLHPNTGSYFVNEMDLSEASFEEFLPYRLKFGFSNEAGGLLSNRTIRENILLPVQYHKSSQLVEWTEWADQLIDRFNLSEFSHLRPASVTSRVRKATNVARALVLKPEVLLLDCPLAGLDITYTRIIVDCLNFGREQGWLKHVFFSSDNQIFINELDHVVVEIKNTSLSKKNEISKLRIVNEI